MDAAIKVALATLTLKRVDGADRGGCISQGAAYETDGGRLVFVKRNDKSEAKRMFDGEFEGLKAIMTTKTIRVPEPLMVVKSPDGETAIITEYIQMTRLDKHSRSLGEQLARLHLHNEKSSDPVKQFGFHVTTCCGYIAQNNDWSYDWVTFYSEQRLQPQVDMLLASNDDDPELCELWPKLKSKIPKFFDGLTDTIKPSLLHGDLWSGNAAETQTEGVVFDPATFYGHSEYDLAIGKMFGGLGNAFFEGYHSIIPPAVGHGNRSQLYRLFHYLNHWNHFGSGYRSQSINIMRKLIAVAD